MRTFEYFLLVGRPGESVELTFQDASGTRALIIDVRKNGGGNSGVGRTILATLIDEPVALEL